MIGCIWAHQQADGVHIWSPVSLQGGRVQLKDPASSAYVEFSLPRHKFFLAPSERLPLCRTVASNHAPQIVTVLGQRRKVVLCSGGGGTHAIPLASQNRTQSLRWMTGERRAKGVFPCYVNPCSALPALGHRDQDRPSGLQQLRQSGLGQLSPGAKSGEQSAVTR